MVECYKKIVCLGKTNWTLCSVLFGLLSTKGTKKKKNKSTTQDSSLACGGRSCALSLCGCSSCRSHPFTIQTSALQSVSENRHTQRKIHRTWKILVTSFGIWVSLYKSSMGTPSRIFSRVSFSHNRLHPLNCFVVVVVVAAVLFLEFIFWSSLCTLKSLWQFCSPASCRLALHATELAAKVCLTGGPTLRLSCRPRGRLQA